MRPERVDESEEQNRKIRMRVAGGGGGSDQNEKAAGLEVVSGIPEIDYLDDLAFPDYLREFRKVANDPQVAKELRANTLPIIGAEWKMEPASDAARDKEIAEFASANILNDGGDEFGRQFFQRHTWKDRTRDILRFLQNGFSVFQKIYRREGRYVVFETIKYLMPESIEEWEFDEKDNLVNLLRSYIDATGESKFREPMKAAQLVIYTWDQEGPNILGKPLIRPMWGPYRMKSMLEKLEVVDKQKTAVGIPFFQLQEDPSPDDETNAEKLCQSMRIGNFEKSYAVIKAGQDFGWKEGGTQAKGIRDIVSGKEEQIAKVGQSTMSELGLAESGSRGTAGAKGAFEAILHTSIAQAIADQEQRNVIELIDLNYPGVVEYPRVVVSRVDPFEQTRNIPAFIEAIAAGAVAADLDTENEIRTRYGFMERAEGSDPPPGPVVTPSFDSMEPGGVPTFRKHRLQMLADAKVDTEKIRTRLESFEKQYERVIESVLKDMRRSAVAEVAKGLEPKKPTQVKVPFQGDLKDRLAALLKTVRDFGREELMDEVTRQLVSTGRMRLQGDPSTRAGAISFANEQAEVLVELNVTSLTQRLQAQITSAFRQLSGQGLGGDELLQELQGTIDATSDRQTKEMARGSTADAFNQGRNVAIQELETQIDPIVVRSEVGDFNSCKPCKYLNGREFRIGTAEYRKHQPPAFCEGSKNCRGFYLAFPR